MDEKVVVLAAGCGKRMQQANAEASLSGQQAKMAEQGIKALIPIDRPFLDYSLSCIADAGYRRVCLIISPHQDQLRDYCDSLQTTRLQTWVCQRERSIRNKRNWRQAPRRGGPLYPL